MSRIPRFVAIILCLLVVCGSAKAAIIAPDPPALSMMMKAGDNPAYQMPPGTVTPIPNGDKWKYQVEGSYSRPGYEVSYSLLIDPDPSVFGTFIVRNTGPVIQDFSPLFTMAVSPGFNPSLLSGSVGLTVTNDSNGVATAATVAPDPIYRALIDGTSVKTLLNHPFSLTVPFANDSATASDRFGIPVPDAGGAVASSISIQLHVSITPGDQVGITSNFTANPVPEPASLLVLVIGSMALMYRGRRG
jgi:hypothetical protein